jgi:hypothetical protein
MKIGLKKFKNKKNDENIFFSNFFISIYRHKNT